MDLLMDLLLLLLQMGRYESFFVFPSIFLRFLVAAFLVCKLCFSLLVLGYGQTGTFLFNILSSCSYAVYRIVNFSSLLVPLCCNKLRLCTYKHTNIHTPSVWEHCGIATRYSNMIDILFTTNNIQQAAPIQWSPNHIILIHCCRLSPGHARVLNCKLLICNKTNLYPTTLGLLHQEHFCLWHLCFSVSDMHNRTLCNHLQVTAHSVLDD